MGKLTPTIRLMTIPTIGKQWEFRPQHTSTYHNRPPKKTPGYGLEILSCLYFGIPFGCVPTGLDWLDTPSISYHPTFDELLAALAKPTPKPPSIGKALGTCKGWIQLMVNCWFGAFSGLGFESGYGPQESQSFSFSGIPGIQTTGPQTNN